MLRTYSVSGIYLGRLMVMTILVKLVSSLKVAHGLEHINVLCFQVNLMLISLQK